MLSSLFSGISGLNANSNAMAVIGDNIANVNTTGFKSSRVSFANILSHSQSGYTGTEIGRGVSMTDVTAQMTQGSLETTENATDLAIHGQGFYVVKDEDGKDFYTRNGEFKFNDDGYLVDGNGYRLQGWDLNTQVGTGGAPTDIKVNNGGSTSAKATSEMVLRVNLDSSEADGTTYATSIPVYDSKGDEIDMTITFTKSGTDWNYAVSVPATVGTCASSGTLSFDANGDLTNTADEIIGITGLTNGANDISLGWNLVDDDTTVTNGDLTSYSTASSTTYQRQDGYPPGTLQTISVDEEGIITGVYSNGQTDPLFQLTLANFPSYWGLQRMGGNLYSESLASGQPLLGTPGSGVLGSINAKALEMSNVDLASEFVNMITTQRAFQANSRVITASDEILTELINIKR